MNGRENEVIVAQQRRASLIAGGIRLIQRQLSQKSLTVGITQGNLRQTAPNLAGALRALEMWFIPPADQF